MAKAGGGGKDCTQSFNFEAVRSLTRFGYKPCHPRYAAETLIVDRLTLFGLFAVTTMLVTYALEARGNGFTLAFAFSCVMGSTYGFLQGAWPFGLVEAVWSLVALHKWWAAHKASNALASQKGSET